MIQVCEKAAKMVVKRVLMAMLIAALCGQGRGQSEPTQYCIVGAGPGGKF